jgi:hypothetical protein
MPNAPILPLDFYVPNSPIVIMKHLALAIILIVAVSMCASPSPSPNPTSTPAPTPAPTQTAPPTGYGYAIIGVTDRNINGENITSVNLTIASVQVHFTGSSEEIDIEAQPEGSQTLVYVRVDSDQKGYVINATDRDTVVSDISRLTGLSVDDVNASLIFGNQTSRVEEDNETVLNNSAGWVTVFQGLKTFNLLDYTNDAVGVLGLANLSAGRYDQIRLAVSEANLTVSSTFDSYGTVSVLNTNHPLSVPSEVIKIIGNFQIRPNTTTVLALHFDVNQSIMKSGGRYILRPVIRLLRNESSSTDFGRISADTGEILRQI